MEIHKSALKLGGVDPSILRELSGAYKPFVKAFKELVSNAYDADADLVQIRLEDDFCSINIDDNGRGMTPFEFQREFTKLGGSYKQINSGLTAKARPKIGRKGIGFLAVARYCSGMEVVSTTLRKHRGKILREGPETTIDLARCFNVPVPRAVLSRHLRVTSIVIRANGKTRRLRSSDFRLNRGRVAIVGKKKPRSREKLEIRYSLDCCKLEFKATIDYDYLLALENTRDLSQVSDFCILEIHPLDNNDVRGKQQYTKITLRGLKNFVMRDLKAPRKSGRIRNVESGSGVDRFTWHLRRCTPIKYDLPKPIQQMFGNDNLESYGIKAIDCLVFSSPSGDVELKRPLWGGNPDREWEPCTDISIPVEIDQGGLRARGYILGHREVIFPGEYRGIAIRVRNVQIGSPTFFGLEQILTGVSRAMLSQVTGEINVFDGVDATDALNPGRDSFYEENPHYKILRRHIVGDGETATGLLGVLIKSMLERLQVLSAVESNLSRANNYRSALLNLSMAINHYGSNGGVALRKFFASSSRPNGLSHHDDYDVLPGPRVAGFRVKGQSDLEQEHVIDFGTKTVYFNFGHERWNNRIFVLGQHYEVTPKMGTNSDPLCEIDTAEKKVYVNWGHPLRQQMGDVAFLKSSVAWKLSYHACRGDIEAMMDLALNLLTFNGG